LLGRQSQSDTNGNVHIYANTYSYSHTHGYRDCDRHRNSYSYGNCYTNGSRHSDGYSNRSSKSNSYRYSNGHSYSNAGTYGYSDAHACTDHAQCFGSKVRGVDTVNLSWSGATSANVDIYRNGSLFVVNVPNTGSYTDNTGQKGHATFTYQVCNAGTQTCSNQAMVTF